MSAYTDLKEALERIIPAGWDFTPYEPTSELPDVTGLTMKIREVSRLSEAPGSAYRVDWVLTITSGLTSRESADPGLFDDLLEFLDRIDSDEAMKWLTWTSATKTVGEDFDRLAYDITLTTLTKKNGSS